MNFDVFNGKQKEKKENLEEILESSIEIEEDLMRTYLITAERIHDDDELKKRLENFAEGNAKRTKQLIDEMNENKEK
jgi:rubrerythrin